MDNPIVPSNDAERILADFILQKSQKKPWKIFSKSKPDEALKRLNEPVEAIINAVKTNGGIITPNMRSLIKSITSVYDKEKNSINTSFIQKMDKFIDDLIEKYNELVERFEDQSGSGVQSEESRSALDAIKESLIDYENSINLVSVILQFNPPDDRLSRMQNLLDQQKQKTIQETAAFYEFLDQVKDQSARVKVRNNIAQQVESAFGAIPTSVPVKLTPSHTIASGSPSRTPNVAPPQRIPTRAEIKESKKMKKQLDEATPPEDQPDKDPKETTD